MSFQRMGISENRNTDNTLHISKRRKRSQGEVHCVIVLSKSQTKNKSLYEDSLTINGIEQFENYKKMVKLEQKRESAIGISRILLKNPQDRDLRDSKISKPFSNWWLFPNTNNFVRCSSIQTPSQLIRLQPFKKQLFNLNRIIKQNLKFNIYSNSYLFGMMLFVQFGNITKMRSLVQKWAQKISNFIKMMIRTLFFNRNYLIISKSKENVQIYTLFQIWRIFKSHSTHTIMRDQQHSQSNNQLKQIAIELQQYFHLRDVSNMYLINIEKYLIKKSNDLNSNNGILTIINNLISRYPEWITIVQGQTDKIVRINRAIDIKQLMLEYECLDCN